MTRGPKPQTIFYKSRATKQSIADNLKVDHTYNNIIIKKLKSQTVITGSRYCMWGPGCTYSYIISIATRRLDGSVQINKLSILVGILPLSLDFIYSSLCHRKSPLKLEIEALFQQVMLYTDTKNKNNTYFSKNIHSSPCSKSKEQLGKTSRTSDITRLAIDYSENNVADAWITVLEYQIKFNETIKEL
ncbi:hypothetical protein AGLY_014139 [Aphis glycines]|uniref:Uncharacterized protein n=1 Tax=Aphis glycines TaxID=307491 RepID=A0A6G0T6B1_APHGL|nr:hypothetical protein AGLY_014139 [Aphis glycines]